MYNTPSSKLELSPEKKVMIETENLGTYYGRIASYDADHVSLTPYFTYTKLLTRMGRHMLGKMFRPWRRMPNALSELTEEILNCAESDSHRTIDLSREQVRNIEEF